MKIKNAFIILFSLVTLALLTSGFRNGPASRGQDKTGSPISSGSCMDCHSSGNYSPSLIVGMYDGDTEINAYEPGKTYTLRYQNINTGSPAVFGFQTVALTEGNKSAGTFGNIPDGFKVTSLDDVDYVEHASPRSLSSFEVEWTAPEEADEVITIYTGSVAANGNGNTGSDGGATDQLALEPNTSNTFDQQLANGVKLFELNATLVNHQLTLQSNVTNASMTFIIYNTNGQVISKSYMLPAAEKSIRIPVGDLAEGMYFIQCVSKGKNQTERFLKA